MKRSDPIAAESPARVAIVGGGCAGLAAAFELSRPEHRGRYHITVYQMGWRLGGKGASGRGASGRIEEHGLHLWMGFYENAFRLMRECYAELGRDKFRCPIARFEDAFAPAPVVAVTDRNAAGQFEPWLARFPSTRGVPGDPLEDDNPFTIGGYLAKAAALVVELLRSAQNLAANAGDERAAERSGGAREVAAQTPPERLIEAVEWLLRHGQLASAAAVCEAVELLRAMFELLPQGARVGDGILLRLIEAIARAARRQLELIVGGDGALRRTWCVVDLILAVMRGAVSHGLALNPQGFDAIDDYDWREWLSLHGASEQALDSGFVRGIYDLVFAYEHGDPARPALSAAVALRGATRMFFTYRGALFWKMNAGMGDVVFAPLYQVLVQRGVRFEFFHRLEEVEISDEHAPDPHVTALRFQLQARASGPSGYRPLTEVHGLPCWPAAPDYAQLAGGTQLEREGRQFESPWETRGAGERRLRARDDFDFVVLAIGGGAVPRVCSQLIARSPKWQRMAANLNTVATQALQLWLTEDTAALGWPHKGVTLSGWVEPFDTWADMSHLVPAEAFAARVKSIAYFCSPLPDLPARERAEDDSLQLEQAERVKQGALRFLNRDLRALWPNACDERGFRWELLASDSAAKLHGEQRIDTQFLSANVLPSDRYVMSLPGTQKHRLSPLDMGFDNLTVAGDWTASGLNSGCVESAVISGLLAACALSGTPRLEEIIGYDHP